MSSIQEFVNIKSNVKGKVDSERTIAIFLHPSGVAKYSTIFGWGRAGMLSLPGGR